MYELLEVFLISMTPISELRGAIPIGISVFNLPVWQVFIVSILGNFISGLIILIFLESVSNFLSKHSKHFKRYFTWLFNKTRSKHLQKFETYESFALILLVAIPLPFTGAWTAALCAFLFNIEIKKAALLIFIGLLIAGIIVLALTLGIINI